MSRASATRLETLKERREAMAEQAESKADVLDRVLESMAEHGSNAYVGHGSVEVLATKWFGSDEEAALEALKKRNDKANYNFAENRFKDLSMTSTAPTVSLKSVGGKADDQSKRTRLRLERRP